MSPVRANTLVLSGFLAVAALSGACSSEPDGQSSGTAGNASGSGGGGSGAAGQVGTAGQPGLGGSGAGMGGSPNGGTGVAGSGGNAGSAGAGSAGASGAGGNAGLGGGGGSGAGKVPMCLTENVDDGIDRATNNYIECDVEEQAIDFDVMANYAQNRKPGYDPSTTPVTFTDYGTAFSGSAVQECHPYCYKSNLTVGLDLIAGAETSLRGEVLFAFPPTVAPITDATGRLSLGWIYVDGPALPAGTKLTVQMVLKNDQGVSLGNGPIDATPQKWIEFKYFPIQNGFQAADLKNVTHIGFRATLAPANMAQDWHGVIYADHFQLRK